MKIIISDYATSMMADHSYEFEILKHHHPEWFIKTVVYDPGDQSEFTRELADTDALITAFIPADAKLFTKAPRLKLISVNAMGFNNVNLEDAAKYGIRVCALPDYCSDDVAEFTLTLILSLTKQLKAYDLLLNDTHVWQYDALLPQKRLAAQTLGIFGLGNIGQKVARLARSFGMNIIAYDPYLPQNIAEELRIPLLSATDIYKKADIITNHMRLTASNRAFFNKSAFNQMGASRHPLFINVARGESVDEKALLDALDTGMIRGAGLDVLSTEKPELEGHPLLKRSNVILTPHAAFYSHDSVMELQRFSCQNTVNFFEDKLDKVNHFVDFDQRAAQNSITLSS
ncbi:D-3-phosphoglycerate dehydrogenase [Liquorilactobacillus sucicola DSM 21376 = JCM 15457]|uniref:Dehydrogenase n=1 Tax=Liquorilactobacillus sucicola DSM 21376 = JCM 15457 TaxID=1423806 RepID=A0A023CXF3_9LACO|nr:NAD(P)-dependent oxidoreductase [Liquorilactobacillus sucicola]KRN06255.1 dehydrogenase [Liquorilactobacillus sucicola DSM 21376 = JCM 15457]GAJ26190.1 D-3-phosphoglycerate dehydrogenase [Liquorilactobacillus sucicola DSM 21376 = JCM 15457]